MHLKMVFKIVFVSLLIHMETKAELSEDMHPFSYSNTQNAVNFHDIFSYTNSLVGGDTVISPEVKEDEYSLHFNPSQLGEFGKKLPTPLPKYIQRYPPPPKFTPNYKLLQKHKDAFESTIDMDTTDTSMTILMPRWKTTAKPATPTTLTTPTTPTITTTTEKVKVTTSRKLVTTTRNPNRERGILDLLFPSSRVKTFKGMFDTFRDLLSYTFKR